MTSARYELQPPVCFYHEFTFEIVHFSDTVLPSDFTPNIDGSLLYFTVDLY